ncbi:MAG: hypothetical protein ACTSR3_01075 [Candidatus Helarchaeota archaeon]
MCEVKCFFCGKIIYVSQEDIDKFGDKLCCDKCLEKHHNDKEITWSEI